MRLSGFTGQNLTYKVVTVVDEPFVIKTVKQDGTIEWSGFSIDLLKILAKKINFQYEIFEGTAYGSLQKGENGSMVWSGMIGDIVSGRADFAVSAMTVTPQREKVVDFTKRYMDYAVGIVMKKKPAVSNLFSFLNPFHKTVWYSIIAGLIVVSLLLYVLNRISPKRIRGPHYHDSSLHGIFWFVYSSLVQQSTDMYLVTMSSQIVIGVWWFFILIIVTLVSSYTANLAAFLTVTQMEKSISSFQDLADQTEMGFGTVGNTSIYDYLKFKSELDNELNSFWSKLWKGVNASQIADANDGFRRVTDSGRKFAFLWDVPIIEYKILNDPDCSLTTVQSSIFEKGYGIAVRRGHPIRDFMSMEILELQDKGDLVKLKNEW
ncbi:unnamed protein product [Oikopleura dioica]|uniref:Ionotropic glutamate receptor C-terminal domain-containing protein n=1 Tax=Oikopleura dioica TaxID=34765 RepID=E4XV61_OIKDI|nr:unnamed protein product [Oikopleura dioica]